MIIGDLNELSSSQEEVMNYKGNSIRYTKFKKIMNENSFVDIGLPYTWWNNINHVDAVFE